MSSAQDGFAEQLDRLLEEGILVTRELYQLEQEMMRLLVSMDFQGLAAAVADRAEVPGRGERLIEQKRELAEEKSLRELIELLPEDEVRSSKLHRYELLLEKLFETRAEQEVNRHFIEEGFRFVHRMQDILSAGKTTYNRLGEVDSPAGDTRPGLDQNC